MTVASVERQLEIQNRSLYIPQRGLMVDLPPSVQNITICPDTGKVTIDPMEKVRLKAIMRDSILENRYPSQQHGEQYMGRVSPQWRDRLVVEAGGVAEEVKQACWSIGRESFAVLLYGSVAKNLAKFRLDEDPSNIDIALIGDFTDAEREKLMDLIRPARQQMTTKIKAAERCRCETIHCKCFNEVATRYWAEATVDIENPATSHDSTLIERVCVIIQTPDTIRGHGYGGARRYISSSARAFYDPYSVWKEIENEALVYMYLSPSLRRKIREGKMTRAQLGSVLNPLQNSLHFKADSGLVNRLVLSLRENT